MRIAQIDLIHVKSYQRASVLFTEGTNAISGPNGAGKSTLLEAIGFVLFDFLPYTQAQFIREGEKSATVTVHLIGNDDRLYHVTRKCGSHSQYYVYDPELGQELTNGKEETVVWLYEFMGVEETGDLSALFQDAVGVPQGLLTAAFLDRPSNRKNTFNPLLRVDEYARVWNLLRDPRRYLEEKIAEEERRIARMEGEIEPLPGLRERVAGLQAAIADGDQRRAASQTELVHVTQRKEALEAVKIRLDQLQQALTQAEADVTTLDALLSEARAAVVRAEEAQSVVSESEAGHQAYLKAQTTLVELGERRKQRDSLNETLQGHNTDLALARQKAETLQLQLEEIARAEGEMPQLAQMVGVQDDLEVQLVEARGAVERLTNEEQNLSRERARLAGLEGRMAEVQVGLSRLAEVEKETASLQAGLETLDEQRGLLTAQIATAQAELGPVREQTLALQAAETAVCPVCEGPLTAEHRSELVARNKTRQEDLQASLADAESQREASGHKRQQTQETLHKLEAEAKRLPRLAEAEELSTQIGDQRDLSAKIEVTVSGLAGAPADVERLEATLANLGDYRGHYQRAADIASRREAVEDDRAATRGHVAELGEQMSAIQAELASYTGLDASVEAGQEALAAYESDHQRFLQHVREAQALAKLQERVEALDSELKGARDKSGRMTELRDQVAASYDATAYSLLVEEHRALSGEIATLSERLRLQRGQMEEGQAEIARLAGLQQELDAARAEHSELEEVLALLAYIRQVLRDAGPMVTQALVNVISQQAERFYSDIMADHSTRLRWTEDYEIVLTVGGRERSFKQLSGGEQMAAALAVRLALLREVSAVDIAFFDEPTANLDDQRRDNLAEQILNVKGFSQLIVISHDDAFERDTDNVVRLVKDNGVSRVEV